MIIIKQVHFVLATLVVKHNAMDVSSLGSMQTAGMSTRAVARELNVHFSTRSSLRFREFGSLTTADHVYGLVCVHTSALLMSMLWRVPHGGGGVMVWAGIGYGQQTQLHFIDSNFNAKIYTMTRSRGPFYFKVSVTNRCASVFPIHRSGHIGFI